MPRILANLLRPLNRRDGAVLVWFAVTAIPLLLAVGVAIDIARAYTVKVRLGAAIDDAGLAVATTLDPNINAQNRLTKYFYGNFASGQIGTPTAVSLVNDATVTNAIVVTGTATVPTTFMALAGFSNITVSATAQIVRRAPNIDFYLLLDSSPSMGIAATQTGINTMIANTPQECDPANPPAGGTHCGCAFACHETNPAGEKHCNATSCTQSGLGNAGGVDNYQLARNLNVTLRIDLVRQAAQNLTTTATSTATQNHANYRMAIYTFDAAFNTIQTLISNLGTVNTSAGNIQQLTVCVNNQLVCGTGNNDEDTNFDNAMSHINTTMPNPGNGSNIAGDTPQEVLFIVTDGVDDLSHTPTKNSYSGGGSRQQYWMSYNTVQGQTYNWCTAVKNRGIRIAILYTEYLPIPNNGWYSNFDGAGSGISSFQSSIGTNLQACASPGLYFMVTTDGDISGALSTLFEQAVQSAYLAQ